ncbi:early nodulin-like protein 2-like [Dorcoceras hygrometricum]|uniref:Early nodulin-like protein 2-like n=1 Tax=Dorcoceras hygrometricum TaxID=472368 RepID=A0A2Z7CRX6_9LAMI|nr:early nodulin-like protein 2-like [Dorcoceras hygrometricum]
MRFLVNDTLLFKYKKGSDSVLVVNRDDYDKCNSGKPILKLDDGDSVFKFDRSGHFFFISGKKSNCDKGQKLIIVVLAVRHDHDHDNDNDHRHGLPPPPLAEAPGLAAPGPEWETPPPAADQQPYPSPVYSVPPGVGDTPLAVNGTGGQPLRRSFAPLEFGPSVFLVSAVSLILCTVGLLGLVGSF